MKALFIDVSPTTRQRCSCCFPWEGGVYTPPEPEGIIATGPLSWQGNRDCTHWKVDFSELPVVDPAWLNCVPYSDSRYPSIKFSSKIYGTLLSSAMGGSQPSFWEYKSGTYRQTESVQMYAQGDIVTYWCRSEIYNSNVLTYWWEGHRRFKIVEGVSSAYWTETWSRLSGGVIQHGENSGTQGVTWRVPTGVAAYPNLMPDVFFKSSAFQYLLRMAYMHPPKDWGQLSSDCMDGFYGLVNNGIQYSAEMTQLKKLAEPLLGIMQGDVRIKALASAYLSWEYGARLSAKDTFSYISQISRDRQMRPLSNVGRLYARDVSEYTDSDEGVKIRFTRNLTLFYEVATNFIVASADRLRKYGFMPSTEIAWDFVPFSFIVDWFLPVGEALNAFDKQGIFDSHVFLENIQTDKIEFSIDLSTFPYLSGEGIFHFTYYKRRVLSSAPRPSMRFDDLNLSYRQIRNGGAILLQNWK